MISIALIFPHTRLAAALAPLTLIFRPALLRPVADGSGCSLPDYPCQAIDPPPLGEDTPRFMSLINDITAKGAAEGMSRLLLEAKAQRRFDEDENSRRLAANIVTTHSAQGSGGALRPDDLLWNERLLLTLAEFVDDEEAGINDKWRQLDDHYYQTLAGLRGGDDSVAPVAAMQPPGQAMADEYRLTQHMTARLKAWSRLYFASDAKPIAVWACLKEAADELFEARAAGSGLAGGEAAVQLGEIVLPSRLSGDEDRAGLAEMAGRLTELLAKEPPAPDDFRVFSDTWRQKLDQYFPATGRGRLLFYDLGKLPAGKVLGGQGQLAASGRFLAVWQPGG